MTRLLKVTYGGYAGSRMQPAEDAEVVIFCSVSQSECDAYAPLNGGAVYCAGDTSHGGHETDLYLDDEGDDDVDPYDQARDDWDV